jgi:hypothetical protein
MFKVTSSDQQRQHNCSDQQPHLLPAPPTTQVFVIYMQISLLQAASGKQQPQQQQSNSLEKHTRCVNRAHLLAHPWCCFGDA